MKRSLAITAIGGIAAASLLAVPGIAGAAGAPAAAPPEPGPRLERACLRLPNLEIRTANLIARLEGDAATRGSLAWLQAQIDKAASRGRQDLVDVLENRLAVRTQTLEVLRLRSEAFPELRQFCIDRGVSI